MHTHTFHILIVTPKTEKHVVVGPRVAAWEHSFVAIRANTLPDLQTAGAAAMTWPGDPIPADPQIWKAELIQNWIFPTLRYVKHG
jgi:hypothetical protein